LVHLLGEFQTVHGLWDVDVGEEHLHVIRKLKAFQSRASSITSATSTFRPLCPEPWWGNAAMQWAFRSDYT
jgi:hypothetical protein